ncbi:MAG: T9SS type A sorting domain-containing protein [Bacteroidia bacterium]
MKLKILLLMLFFCTFEIKAQQTRSETEIPSGEIQTFSLSQNYPNPAKDFTRIKFQLSTSGYVSLKLFDVLGKPVFTLLDQQMNAGTYIFPLETNDFPEGIYFYELKKENATQTLRMIISK